MAAIVCQKREKDLYALDEFFLENSGDILEPLHLIVDKYADQNRDATIELAPDWKTGKVNETDAISAWNLLRPNFRTVRQMSFFNVSDTRHVDSINSLNQLFSCKQGASRVYIAEGMRKTIRDLNQMTFKSGTRNPDTEDESLGHYASCLRIIAYRLFPVKRDSVPKRSNRPTEPIALAYWKQRHEKKGTLTL
jgi:hypothetical protein